MAHQSIECHKCISSAIPGREDVFKQKHKCAIISLFSVTSNSYQFKGQRIQK